MNFIIALLSKFPVPLLLIMSAASVVAGDFFAKYWSLHTRSIFFVLAVIGYLGSSFFYIPTLLKEGLVVTSVIWSVLSIVGFLLVGLIVFKETLNPLQSVGVGLGVLSLIILSLAK